MLRDFNLLATTSRGNEGYASSEMHYLLKEIGDSVPTVYRTSVSGLVAVKTAFNPIEAVEKLRTILHEHPYKFRYTLRIIPIERVLTTNLSEIERIAEELSSMIDENETFRITVEKRFTDVHSKEIIEAAAAKIERKVDLKEPDKILLIEVVGRQTGMSVIKPNNILSVLKEKMR